MKKLFAFVCAALLIAGVADAKTRTVQIPENGGSYSFTIADGASDTTKFASLQDAQWVSDGAGDADGALIAWVGFTFTAASTDSFSCIVDYYVGGVKSGTTSGTLDAATSGALNVVALDPGFLADAIRVRLGNTDVTGSASATGVQVFLIYKDDEN